jgi:hypothetical protein
MFRLKFVHAIEKEVEKFVFLTLKRDINENYVQVSVNYGKMNCSETTATLLNICCFKNFFTQFSFFNDIFKGWINYFEAIEQKGNYVIF